MDPNAILLLDCLNAIFEGTMTLDYFRELAGMRGVTVTNEIINFLLERGIGKRNRRGLLSFSSTDKVKTSILAISSGVDIMKISQFLSWKDFERFASEILLNCGFKTINNVRFTKPRAEIDIVATKSNLCLSIDCKHWANNARNRLFEHTQKQIQRTERLLGSPFEFRIAVPVLLTIYPNFEPYFSNLVPIVDISKFRAFVNEIESNAHDLRIISRDKM
jgi:restriction endonuclease